MNLQERSRLNHYPTGTDFVSHIQDKRMDDNHDAVERRYRDKHYKYQTWIAVVDRNGKGRIHRSYINF